MTTNSYRSRRSASNFTGFRVKYGAIVIRGAVSWSWSVRISNCSSPMNGFPKDLKPSASCLKPARKRRRPTSLVYCDAFAQADERERQSVVAQSFYEFHNKNRFGSVRSSEMHRLDWCGTEMARMARLGFMTLPELLKAANQGYPDGYLAEYYDTKTGARKPGRGDTLAEFIVAELIDTFDPGATDDVQIGLATHVLERARTDLFDVIQALRERSSTSPVAK